MAAITIAFARTKTEASVANAFARNCFRGHITSVICEKSMGTNVSHSVVVWPKNRPGPDTSCVECGRREPCKAPCR